MSMLISYAMIASLALPPKRYDYEPTVPYSVAVISKEQLRVQCGIPDRNLLGCAYPAFGLIIIRDDLTGDAFKRVLRHEKGHINGWSHYP